MHLRWSFAFLAVAQIAIAQPSNQFDAFFADRVVSSDAALDHDFRHTRFRAGEYRGDYARH